MKTKTPDEFNSKMREVLVTTRKRLVAAYESDASLARHNPNKPLVDLIDEALATPPRNCDVGTADEQTARFRKFCSAHKYLSSDFSYICKGFGKGRCPFSKSHTKSQCEFAWSQMPYEEGGAK